MCSCSISGHLKLEFRGAHHIPSYEEVAIDREERKERVPLVSELKVVRLDEGSGEKNVGVKMTGTRVVADDNALICPPCE